MIVFGKNGAILNYELRIEIFGQGGVRNQLHPQ